MPAACPPPDVLARLAQGGAPPGEVGRYGEHVATCPLCRSIAHGLGGGGGRPPAPPAPDAPPRPPIAPAPRNLWWVPWVTHAAIALLVGLLGWWFLGR